MIYSYGPKGCVVNEPDTLSSNKSFIMLCGGKLVISTQYEFGVVISTSGEKMQILPQDCDDFHETSWGTYLGIFSKTGSLIEASGRIVLFHGTSVMNVEFDNLWMSSDIPDDVDFNFNIKKPQAHPPKQSQAKTASSGDQVKKHRCVPTPHLNLGSRPRGRAPLDHTGRKKIWKDGTGWVIND